uniref:Uncharacterized protein n=1 Tax=Cuerna arida TaxID=1464854 RepID=A0A1B6FW08_9HEMI
MSDLPSTSRNVRYDDPRSNERILQFLREIEDRESGEEIDDSDQDPDFSPSDVSGQSSDSDESTPEHADEELIDNEDEFLVVENYVDGEDEFFGGKMELYD